MFAVLDAESKLPTPTALRFTRADDDARSVAAHARASVLDAFVLDMFDRGGFARERARA
jgi:hypothetical protein